MTITTQVKRTVYCTFNFEGWHTWPNAPEQFKYLSYPHRHLFYVRAEMSVTEADREVEFIFMKSELLDATKFRFASTQATPFSASCETIAEAVATVMKDRYGQQRHIKVDVSEDNENGGTYEYIPQIEL